VTISPTDGPQPFSLSAPLSSARLQPDLTIQAQDRRLKKIGGDRLHLTVVAPLQTFDLA
jgi:hypothetical protein